MHTKFNIQTIAPGTKASIGDANSFFRRRNTENSVHTRVACGTPARSSTCFSKFSCNNRNKTRITQYIIHIDTRNGKKLVDSRRRKYSRGTVVKLRTVSGILKVIKYAI